LGDKTEIQQDIILETDFDEAISPDRKSETDEDTVAVGNNNNVNRSQDKIWSRQQNPWNSGGVNLFIGALSGLKN
jgi:hypothetical protein